MKFTKKTIVLAIALMCILTTAVFGTIAYLTDTDEVTNTFSIGNVDIDVDETKVDENGEPVQKKDENGNPIVDGSGNPVYERTEPDKDSGEEGNTYPMIPGASYTKDPTMTVKQGSEPSFYRMKVTVNCTDVLNEIFAPDTFELSDLVVGLNSNWVQQPNVVTDNEAHTATYEFRYNGDLPDTSKEDKQLPALFTTLKIPTILNGEDCKKLSDLSINVVGNAIQQTGFAPSATETAEEAAWKAFDAQTEREAAKNNTEDNTQSGDENSTPDANA